VNRHEDEHEHVETCWRYDLNILYIYTAELGYNAMKGTQYFVSLYTSVVITEYTDMVKSDELIVLQKIWRYRRGVV
jgi:hypothetical protein